MRPARIGQVLAVSLARFVLGCFTLSCFFWVILNIVDEGGGASGIEARRRVTVEQRLGGALMAGSLGLIGAVAMVGVNRLGRHSPHLKFSLDPLILIIALIAACSEVMWGSPLLGIPLAALSATAMMRTVFQMAGDQTEDAGDRV